MIRLIDADALTDELIKGIEADTGKSVQTTFTKSVCMILCKAIEQQPTVDAEPVRHGKWIDIDEQTYTWKVRCYCCGYERSMMSTQGKYPNYCEECGSRMDEE